MVISVSLLVLIVQMKLLHVCGTFLMVIILQLSLCLYEMEVSVVCVDDYLLSLNVMLPLSSRMQNGIHLFVIGGIHLNYV